MSDYSFTYQVDNFSLAKAHDAELYIKAGKKDVSFLIAEQGRLLAWKDNCELTDLSEENELTHTLTSSFKSVVIGLLPDALTLVPQELFTPEQINVYAQYLDVKPEDKVFAAKFDANNELIYKAGSAILNILASKFDLKNTVPADRGWAAAIAKTDPGNQNIYIDMAEGRMAVLNFNAGHVRFYNSFETGGIEDVLYYCLFAAEQLELKPGHISLIVSGCGTSADVEKLAQFFRTVKYNDSRLLELPDEAPSYQILSLAALA